NSSTGLQRLPHQRHYSRGQRPVTRADAVATGPEMVEEIAEGSPGDIQCEGGDGDGKTNVPRCIQTKLVSDPASGYYEWHSIGKEKQPYYMTPLVHPHHPRPNASDPRPGCH